MQKLNKRFKKGGLIMRKKRALLVSCSIIMLCMCIIVGSTYALFTDSATVKNHLKAGNLDVTLTRTNLEYRVLDEYGMLKTTTVGTTEDFTGATGENVFGIDATDMKIVPGSYFDATMELANGGNVAFNYMVTIKLISGSNALAEQIDVTITHPDNTKTEVSLDQLIAGLEITVGTMKNGDTVQTFGVRVDFPDQADNNDAKDLAVVFDLIVTATQATA